MDKIFDRWNEVKKQTDRVVPAEPFPMLREVWICILGKNIGVEQNGELEDFLRPVLVVKKFNNSMFLVIPLSTKQKLYDFYYNFTDPSGASVSAVLAQVRLVSIKRFKRKLYDFPTEDFGLIKLRLKSYFS